MVVDFNTRKAQPPGKSRGAIARIYLYMSDPYSIRLSKSQQRQMVAWNNENPPASWECERDKRFCQSSRLEQKFC
jgi:deoxyribonuclease-1